HFIQTAKILRVFHMIRQSYIQPALLFAEGKIALAVDGESKDLGIVRKNLRRTIPLMHVKINDGGAPDHISFSQHVNGDSNIIEDAESRAFPAKSMMRAST